METASDLQLALLGPLIESLRCPEYMSLKAITAPVSSCVLGQAVEHKGIGVRVRASGQGVKAGGP